MDSDKKIILKYILGGALTGGSLLSFINLLRLTKDLHKDIKKEKELLSPETGKDTIVLTLPRELVEKKSSMIKKIEMPVSSITLTKLFPQPQTKSASNWQTLTLALIGAFGGGVGAALAADLVYKKVKEKELEEKLKKSHEEYLDLLLKSKQAEAVNDSTFTKDAKSRSFGYLDYPLAGLTLATLLGAGTVGYLTKKYLDERLKAKEEGVDVPKIQRIVFRVSSKPKKKEELEPNEEKATSEDIEVVKAALALHMDVLDPEHKILNSLAGKHKDILLKQGIYKINKTADTNDQFTYGSAVDPMVKIAYSDKSLRDAIIRAAYEHHPLLKTAFNLALSGFLKNAYGTPAYLSPKSDVPPVLKDWPYIKIRGLFDPTIQSQKSDADRVKSIKPITDIVFSNKTLRDAILRYAFQQHPILRHLGDKAFYLLKIPGVEGLIKRRISKNIANIISDNQVPEKKSSVNKESEINTGDIIGGIIGGQIAGSSSKQKSLVEAIDRLIDEQEEKDQEKKKEEIQRRKQKIIITAADPEAAKYLKKKLPRIQEEVNRLIEEGKL